MIAAARRAAARWGVLLCLLPGGCAYHWEKPRVDPVQASDRRDCSAGNRCVDLVVVVDTSGSSSDAPGEDPTFSWNPVRVGLFHLDPPNGPESRLWIGLDGVDSALNQLNATRVGVALVGFAGRFEENRPETASWLEAPLTDDYSLTRSGVTRIRARGPAGVSCHACAVRFAQSLLAATASTHCRAIVMVGDTDPTRPYGPARMAANQREFATAVAESPGVDFTLVALGHENALQIERLSQLLASSGSKLVSVRDAAEVTRAIVTAADACE